MPNQSGKFKQLERFMNDACSNTNLGGYNILTSTLTYLKQKLKIDTGGSKPDNNVVGLFNNELGTIANQGFTIEEINQIEAQHSEARTLITESMMLLYENSEKTIRGYEARNTILAIAKHGKIETPFLADQQIQDLIDKNISSVDTDWILHENNVDGQEILIKNTVLNVREAFAFYDTLSHQQKMNLARIRFDAVIFIQKNIRDLKNLHLPLDETLGEINNIFANKPSQHERLQEEDVPAGLTLAIIKLFLIDRLKQDLLKDAIRHHLTKSSDQFLQVIKTQPLMNSQALHKTFQQWKNCKIAAICPAKLPVPMSMSNDPHAPEPAATLSSALAKLITNSEIVTLENAADVVKVLIAQNRMVEFFNYESVKLHLSNGTDLTAINALFTPEFQAQLLQDMAKNVVYNEAHESMTDYMKEALFASIDTGKELTNALTLAVSCYFAKNTIPLISSVCESSWKMLDTIATKANIHVLEAPQRFMPAALANTRLTTREEPFSNSSLIAFTALTASGVAVSAYMAYSHFKRKAAANKSQPLAEHRPLLP